MQPESGSRVSFGDFVLDPVDRVLLRNGAPVLIRPRVFDVLVALTSRPGALVTKEQLMEAGWPDVVVDDNAVSVTVSRLRTVLGDTGRQGRYIETVQGYGYRFVAPVTPAVEARPSLTVTPVERRFRTLPIAAIVLLVTTVLVAGLTQAAGRRSGADEAVGPAGIRAATSPEAEEAYQRGVAILAARRNFGDAAVEFRAAIRLDSTHAGAWAGLADIYAMSHSEPQLAETAARRALALDPRRAEAWASLGFALAMQSWQWEPATQALERAIELEPRNTKALQWLATVRMIQRRFDEATLLLERALAVEARPGLYADVCQLEYYRHDFAEARAACDRARRIDPGFPALHNLDLRLALMDGRPADAMRLLVGDEGVAGRDVGRADVVAYLLSSVVGVSSGPNAHSAAAEWHALSGDTAGALDALDQAVDERAFMTPFLNADPTVDSIRDDPRFQAAMRRIGLN